jgi:hypothetical protein
MTVGPSQALMKKTHHILRGGAWLDIVCDFFKEKFEISLGKTTHNSKKPYQN